MPENFKFDRELFEKAVNKDVTERNFLLMDDLSKIKMCVEKALETCLETTTAKTMTDYRSVGI